MEAVGIAIRNSFPLPVCLEEKEINHETKMTQHDSPK
jgi:hypothetical protein